MRMCDGLKGRVSFVKAMRKLTACRSAIGDQHADKVASSVCYKLTGHEDLAIQALANGLVLSEPTQQGQVETRVHLPDEMGSRLVATPAGDALGRMRSLPVGFWVATEDPSREEPFVVSHRAGRPAVVGAHVLRGTLHHHRAWPPSLSGA